MDSNILSYYRSRSCADEVCDQNVLDPTRTAFHNSFIVLAVTLDITIRWGHFNR